MDRAHANYVITTVFNFKNAKRIAFLLMVFFSLYHGILMLTRPSEFSLLARNL